MGRRRHQATGGELSVFEIGFFSTLFAGFFVVFAKPRGERWREFWQMERPLAVQARALSGIAAGMLGIYAFTTIPLAEAYFLIFMSPLFVTILSIVVLGEKIGPWRFLAVIAGFAGVLLVVQPGFRDLEPGHLAAALIAVLAAVTVFLLRSLAGEADLRSSTAWSSTASPPASPPSACPLQPNSACWRWWAPSPASAR